MLDMLDELEEGGTIGVELAVEVEVEIGEETDSFGVILKNCDLKLLSSILFVITPVSYTSPR